MQPSESTASLISQRRKIKLNKLARKHLMTNNRKKSAGQGQEQANDEADMRQNSEIGS